MIRYRLLFIVISCMCESVLWTMLRFLGWTTLYLFIGIIFLSLGAATARTCLAYSVTGNVRECSKVTVVRVLDARWAEAFHVRFMDVDNRSRISHVTGGVQAPSSFVTVSGAVTLIIFILSWTQVRDLISSGTSWCPFISWRNVFALIKRMYISEREMQIYRK